MLLALTLYLLALPMAWQCCDNYLRPSDKFGIILAWPAFMLLYVLVFAFVYTIDYFPRKT